MVFYCRDHCHAVKPSGQYMIEFASTEYTRKPVTHLSNSTCLSHRQIWDNNIKMDHQ
jgi:hypothetical protein